MDNQMEAGVFWDLYRDIAEWKNRSYCIMGKYIATKHLPSFLVTKGKKKAL